MRCQSYVNIPASEMFAAAGSGGRTFDSFLQKSGRAEAIWFPFTDKPWLKVWTPTPRCPFGARAVNGPFNYPFSDNIPKALSDLLAAINTGHPELTPLLGKLQYDLVVGGMALTLGYDLWGWSKDLLLYIKPSTLRVTANGYAVLTRRRDVQRVINEFYLQYQTMVAAYRANGHYPMNGPVEIRVSGLDQPGESIVPGAQVPSLSAIRPRPDQPEWDTAIWLDILSLPVPRRPMPSTTSSRPGCSTTSAATTPRCGWSGARAGATAPPPPGTSRRWSTSWWRSRYARAWSQTTIGTAPCAS